MTPNSTQLPCGEAPLLNLGFKCSRPYSQTKPLYECS